MFAIMSGDVRLKATIDHLRRRAGADEALRISEPSRGMAARPDEIRVLVFNPPRFFPLL